jgi:hypothetical protein
MVMRESREAARATSVLGGVFPNPPAESGRSWKNHRSDITGDKGIS